MLSHKTTTLCVLLISLVASADISPKVVTCEECQEAYGNLVTRLLTEDSLVEQMDLLKTSGCSVLEDPVACNELVDTWWTLMAGVLYPNLMNPQELCNSAGVCDIARDWTSEDCAEQMASWIPIAIPVLSAALRDQEIQLCQE